MASSIPSLTIETLPSIKQGLGMVRSLLVKKEKTAELGLDVFTKLATIFKSIEGLSPISSSRVSYLGNTITTTFEKFMGRGPELQLCNLISELINLKNALQVEATCFGLMYPFLCNHIKLISNPILTDLQTTLPAIINEMQYEPIRDNLVINLQPLQTLFEGVRMGGMSLEFDVFMLNFARSSFAIHGDKIHVHMPTCPTAEELGPFLQHRDPFCKLIAQVLYACVLEKELMEKYFSMSRVIKIFLQEFETGNTLYIEGAGVKTTEEMGITTEGLPYREYLTHEGLIPLFASMIKERDRCVKEGIPCSTMMHSTRLSGELLGLAGEDWREEAGQMYELLLHIEGHARSFLSKSSGAVDAVLKHLDVWAERDGCDDRVLKLAEICSDILRVCSPGITYPLSPKTPFCASKDHFKSIPIYSLVDRIVKRAMIEKASGSGKKSPITDDDFMDASVRAPPRVSKPSKKQSQRQRAAASGSSTGKMAYAEDEVLAGGGAAISSSAGSCNSSAVFKVDRSSVSHSERKAPTEAVARRELAASLLSSKSAVASWKLAPRVQAWIRSVGEGLAHYHYSPDTHVLSREEMIIRHRLPPQMLSLVCNEFFSKLIHREELPVGSTHFELCIFIGGNRYMLEATLDGGKNLYHFYARPIRSLEDYIRLAKDAPAEFPALGAEMAPLDLREVEEGITFDPQGNACFTFEGNEYKVLLLKPLSS